MSATTARFGHDEYGHRTRNLLPGRLRNRRSCPWSCPNRTSHVGLSGGVALTSGCGWHMAQWVRSGPSALRVAGGAR